MKSLGGANKISYRVAKHTVAYTCALKKPMRGAFQLAITHNSIDEHHHKATKCGTADSMIVGVIHPILVDVKQNSLKFCG